MASKTVRLYNYPDKTLRAVIVDISTMHPEMASIEGIILDLDGVLWRTSAPIGNLPAIFSKIRKTGWRFVFATNNATLSVTQYMEKIRKFGLEVEREQVITSGVAVAQYLRKKHPKGGPVYIIGESGLVETLAQSGFYQSENHPLAVISSLDRQLTYDKLSLAVSFIRSGVPFLATNSDPTLPTPDGFVPGSGSILAALKVASNRKPLIVGKPYPTLFKLALDRLGTKPENTLVVGDQLATDIAGGIAVGCQTALVLSGVTNSAQVQNSRIKSTYISQDLTSLIEMILA
jgi:HAD superfamily hydrolase (TIGR01457 family)